MKIKSVERDPRAFNLQWHDGSDTVAPFIWLRDNDPNELHPQTHERIFDLLSVPIDIQPLDYALTEQGLEVKWPNKQGNSAYSHEWLWAHIPGQGRADPARIPKLSWADTGITELPRFDAAQCIAQRSSLLDALIGLKQNGIILLQGLADYIQSGEHFADLIGFKRESNYGVMFEVQSKPDPNNLAYTSLELPLHTDLANQEFVPGNQFLHCYRNTATGGGSRFADALSIVNKFEQDCSDQYQLLCDALVPWRFIDHETDLRQHRPVIGLNKNGDFTGLTFNAHLADVPDFEPDLMYDFYAAFQELMRRIRYSPHNIEHVLQPGEMVVFDNQRILHGRAAFDPNSGERHLRGYYIEHNEIENRIRILSK